MRLTEFYPKLQGRPESKIALDMDQRGPSIPIGYISGIMLQSTYSSVTMSNNYTATDKTLILVNAGGSPVTVTLPTASANAGRYYIIKKVDTSTNQVTIKPQSGELIDGENSLTLRLQYQYVTICCSGMEVGNSYWHVIGGEYVKMEDILENLLNQQIGALVQLLIEVKQMKLHLAGMSNEPITEDSITIDDL